MESQVEKMYENAGVKKLLYCDICKAQEHALGLCAETKCEPFYPPFTAEKQLKIIEWLGNSKAFFDANETIFSLITNHKNKNGVVKGYEGKGNSVDSCLASLINNLWQDLTEEERKQIKEILSE